MCESRYGGRASASVQISLARHPIAGNYSKERCLNQGTKGMQSNPWLTTGENLPRSMQKILLPFFRRLLLLPPQSESSFAPLSVSCEICRFQLVKSLAIERGGLPPGADGRRSGVFLAAIMGPARA